MTQQGDTGGGGWTPQGQQPGGVGDWQQQPQQQADYGAQPAPQPYGAPAQQPYGAPAQQPYGAPAPQPYGLPPQPAPQPYGVPAQPAAQPFGMPGAAGGLGFDLNPDERVLWAVKRTYTTDKVTYWILGVMFALVLIGLLFIYMAVTIEGKNPRALVLTNRRLVVLEGSGKVSVYWLNQYVDLSPRRAQARAGGGGLIGAVVSAAVSAGLNALANRNEKTTPAYWGRTIAVLLKQHDGRDIPVDVRPNEAVVVGPLLARCILMGEADTLPPFDARSIQVGAAVASASAPGYWIGGGVLMFFSTFLGYTGLNRIAWGGYGVGLVFTVIGLGMLVGAFALFYSGARAGWKVAESQGKKPNKLFPLAIPGVIFLLLTVLIVGSTVLTAVRAYRFRSEYSSYTSPVPTVTAPPTSTLSKVGGTLSPGAIETVLLAQGYRYTSGSAPDKADWAGATTWTWSMTHTTNPNLWARLVELPYPDASQPRYFAAAQQQAIAVQLSGTGASMGQALMLGAAITSKTPTSGKAVATALTGAGWKLSAPMLADASYANGYREYLAFAKKGALSATVHLLDYSQAAGGTGDAAVQASGTRVLIVSAGKSSSSQDLLRKIQQP